MELMIDEELKNLLPPLQMDERLSLEQDIVNNGILSPIIVWNGYIIDGHNRYEIAQKYGIKIIPTKELNFESKADVMKWMVESQFAKRNLTKSEKVKLLSKVEEEYKRQAKENQISGGGDKKTGLVKLPKAIERVNVSEKMAERVGVSEKTYRDMKYVVENGTPEQIQRMDKGGNGNGVNAIAQEIKDTKNNTFIKICKICGKEKSIDDFYSHHRSSCKECFNKKRKDYFYDLKGNELKVDEKYKHIKEQDVIDRLYNGTGAKYTPEIFMEELDCLITNFRKSVFGMLKRNKDVAEVQKDEIIQKLCNIVSEKEIEL